MNQLHDACMRGNLTQVTFLLSNEECDINSLNTDGESPLHIACENHHLEIVKVLLKYQQCDLNIQNNDGNTPMHLACKNRLLNIIELLLEMRCSTNIPNKKGETAQDIPLNEDGDFLPHIACQWGDVDIVRYLITYNPNVQSSTSENTPLHIAAKYGQMHIIALLLSCKECNPNIQNKDGDTLLHFAVRQGRTAAVSQLLAHQQCNVNVQNKVGNTPLHTAVIRHAQDDAIVRLLSCKECNPNVQNREGDTPLHIAVRENITPAIHELLNSTQCSPNILNNDHLTPLLTAIKHNNPTVAAILLQHNKCDPTLCDSHGNTPLHLACIGGETQPEMLGVAKRLLTSVDPSCVNNVGQAPIELTTNYQLIQAILHIVKCKTKQSVQTYINIFFVGNPEVGKSTLVKAICKETTSMLWKFVPKQARLVENVPLHTAGIIPTTFKSKTFGNTVIYDLAGQVEYYTSHAAVIRSTVISTPPALIVVVNLSESEEKIIQTLRYWWSFIDNHAAQSSAPPEVILVGSHADVVKSTGGSVQEKMSRMSDLLRKLPASFHFAGHVALDCRDPASKELQLFVSLVNQSCTVLRQTADVDVRCHVLYAFLLKRFRGKVACTVSDIAISVKESSALLPQKLDSLIPLISTLSDKGLLLLVKGGESHADWWIILQKQTLLGEINGTIFAPMHFRQHNDLSWSTGVVPFSKLKNEFPDYNPNMISEFLTHLEFCFRIEDHEALALLKDEAANVEDTSSLDVSEEYYFFPALVNVENPLHVWEENDDMCCKCGWFYQCIRPDQFLTTQFLHVLILRLAFIFALRLDPGYYHEDSLFLCRKCSVWKHGIAWLNRVPIETVVEVGLQYRSVTVMMRCPKGKEAKCGQLHSKVIQKVLEAKDEHCKAVEMSESFIHPTDVKYPFTDNIEDVKVYSLTEIARGISSKEEEANALDRKGQNPTPVQDLLLFDPCNSETSTELLRELFSKQHSMDETVRSQVLEILNSVPQTCEYPDTTQEQIDHILSICEQVMREYGKIDQTIMHCIFVGPPGVGKSSLLKRLLHMKLDQTRTSTQVVEKSVIVRNVSTSVAQMSHFNWQIMEDPITQAAGLIGQLPEKEDNYAIEDPAKKISWQTKQESRQQDSFLTLSAEELDNSAITTSHAKSHDNSQTNKPPVEAYWNQPEKKADASEQSKASDSESSQLSKTIEFFRQVLKEKGVSRVHVDNPCTLYLTDSGGQPEFQELLPSLVVGPCVFFVVFPLHKDLNSKYEVEYERPNEDKCIQKYTSSLTIKEDLMRSLATIASIEYKDIYGKEVKPRVMFAATFKDKVPHEKDCQRTLKELQDLVKETDAFRRGMIVDASETQMVFTINNASDEEAEKDAEKIRDACQKIAAYFEVSTPYPWLIFNILLQHLYVKDSVVHKDECIKVAQECGIHSETEFEAALQFLHKQTGVLQYYKLKKPSELFQIVIRDPQCLFSRINHLVEETFTFKKTQCVKCTTDFKKGIFKDADYKELTKPCSSDPLAPSMLLDLLVHLNVVVPLGDGEKYFMPCAITHIDDDSSTYPRQSATIHDVSSTQPSLLDTIPPLLVTFKSGYCPKGLFGVLVACIVRNQVADCKLSLDESEIHRDQICFMLSLHRLLLRINPTYIYIEFIPYRTDMSTDLFNLCNNVRKSIEDNIAEACKTLHYSNRANYGLSFICQCSEEDMLHPAELRHDPVSGQCFLCTRSKKEALVNPDCHIWLPEPNILLHPESQSVTPGMVVEFRVKATGHHLQFQWKKDCKDVYDGTKYRGTNTNTLCIKDVEKSDKGCYQCLVKNYIRGKLSEEAALKVSDPPKITQHPECKSVATGQSTTFTVEATGDNLHYQWQKDDIDLSDDNRNHDTGTHTLRIMKVEKSDNKARYQCLVKNEIGEEFSKDALLTVIDPPKITQHPESKSITTGADVTMTVRATGDNLHYRWQKDGIDLSDDDRHRDTGTHTLGILKMEKNDNKARYRCLVKNEIGEEFSKDALLTVIDPPKITQHPESKSVATGADVTMTVRATGDNLHYRWQKDGIDLSDDDRHRDTGTHTLGIVKMEKSDNKARYRCLVKNEIGEEFSKDALLTVIDPPKITQHPESKSITTGADVIMTVRATGDNLHYQWQKDGIDLSDDDRHRDTGTHTLRIVKVEKGDNKARYRCLVKNKIGVEFSKDALRTVIDPPKITQHLESKSVATGADVTMTVRATGDNLHYRWQKDGIDLSDDDRHRDTGTHTLRIVKVEKGDNKARYRCLVKNEIGEEFSKDALLTVIDPPKITQHPESKSVATGADVTMTVRAAGDNLHYQWQKDGIDLSDDDRHRDTGTHTLHILKVEKSDNKARYRCHVKNEIGEEFSKDALLTVIDPPKITQHPESKSVATGADVTMTVRAAGDNLHYQWQKDGIDLSDDDRHRDTGTHTLHILKVEKSDNKARYRCHVKNEIGEEFSKDAVLTVSHNWTQFVCLFLLVLLVTVVGMWWLLPSNVIHSAAVDCGTLPDPANGRVSHTTRTTFGQAATYSCNTGYNLVGDSTRMCQAAGVWSGNAPTCQYKRYSPDSVESLINFDGPPTLDDLRHFPVKKEHIDIAVEIGPDYEKFGTLLLEDKKGNKVKNIKVSEHGDPVDITVEILKQWLQGKGRKPVTWQILVKGLRDTNLNALADDIESSSSEHDGSKNSDKAPSEEL